MTKIAIDFDTLTPEQAWYISDNNSTNKDLISHKDLFNSDFSKILVNNARVENSQVINGYTIEFCDCFLYLVFRVPQLDNNWIKYFCMNSWDSTLSWEPECVRFGSNEEYLIYTSTWDIFELKINKE